MKTATLATATSLLASSYAATVTLQTTPCLDTSIPSGEQFGIELNAGVVAKDLPRVCGLKIVSASAGTNINSIQCQAFRDTAGTQSGSTVFTFASPALIGTNPREAKSIKCTTNGASGSASSSLASSTSASGSVASSVVTITSTVGPSSGLPSASVTAGGNGTTLSVTPTPSASQSGRNPVQSGNGAVGKVSVGMGVILGAIVALFA